MYCCPALGRNDCSDIIALSQVVQVAEGILLRLCHTNITFAQSHFTSPDVGTLCTRDITYCMLNVHEVIRERECRIIIQINSVTSIFDLGSLVQVAEGGPPKKIILRPRWQWNYFPIEYDHPTLQRLEWYSVLRKAGHIG